MRCVAGSRALCRLAGLDLFQVGAAVRAFAVGSDHDPRLADRTEDLQWGGRLVLGLLGQDRVRDGPQVEGGAAAIEADVAGLDHSVVYVFAPSVDVDLGEQGSE